MNYLFNAGFAQLRVQVAHWLGQAAAGALGARPEEGAGEGR